MARASSSSLLTPSPHAQRSRACLCDCAGALATRINPLQCGRRAQRLAPPSLTVALCASHPRPPRREPVHPSCSCRLDTSNAHTRASMFAPARLPRTSPLCSVAVVHSGWRHYRSWSHCVLHSRDPHGESQCIPLAHAVSTRTTSRACLCDCAGALAARITSLQCGRRAQRLAPLPLTVALCASKPRPHGRASESTLLTPSPHAQRSRACPCDCAGALAMHITPLQCGRRAQRLAPPSLTVALCASQPRPPRQKAVRSH